MFWHQSYQDQLSKLGIKDDRIRRPLSRKTISSRLVLRLLWSGCLFSISLPGLLLWLPIFVTTFIAVHNFKKTGPIFDTWDEIAQYKLTYGLVSGLCVWAATVALTRQYMFVTICLTPALMWMTLRWFEDAVSSFRAFTALYRLLRVGKSTLKRMREVRKDLHRGIMDLAVSKLNLPAEPESYFVLSGGREKGRVRGKWDSSARYFSIKRRRKRDWDETLRLYDKVDWLQESRRRWKWSLSCPWCNSAMMKECMITFWCCQGGAKARGMWNRCRVRYCRPHFRVQRRIIGGVNRGSLLGDIEGLGCRCHIINSKRCISHSIRIQKESQIPSDGRRQIHSSR